MRPTIFFLLALLAFPALSYADEAPKPAPADPFAMSESDWKELSDDDALQLAELMWFSTASNAKLTGAAGIARFQKANDLLRFLIARNPTIPGAYWRLARNNFVTGEQLPEEAKTERLALYEEMIKYTTLCIEKVDPNDAGCRHFLATGMGRRGTTKGFLNVAFTAKHVETEWLKAYKLGSDYMSADGEPMMNNVRYGLGVYYRIVPDSWMASVLLGTRGDKKKSVDFFREAVVHQPFSTELQKELGVGLLCYGQDAKVAAAVEEGRAILKRIVAGDFDVKNQRSTDTIDKQHAKLLLENPKPACGYSRDGFQDTDVSKLKK
jgi:hypothetical protein